MKCLVAVKSPLPGTDSCVRDGVSLCVFELAENTRVERPLNGSLAIVQPMASELSLNDPRESKVNVELMNYITAGKR
jgi:hypothetical protein